MYPILFKIGSLTIYSYNVFLALAFLFGLYLVMEQAKREGIDRKKILSLGCLLIFTQFAVRILGLLFEQYNLTNVPFNILKVSSISYGVIIIGIIVTVLYCYKEKMSFWKIVDIGIPSIALGYAICRIGCFFNGCCYGKILFIPTQLFESFTLLIIFLILIIYKRHKKGQGELFLLYLILYGLSRFVVEFFRQDYTGELIYNLLTISQFFSILSILVATTILITRKSNKNLLDKIQISRNKNIREGIEFYLMIILIVLIPINLGCGDREKKRIITAGSPLLHYVSVYGDEISNIGDVLHVSKFVTTENFGAAGSDDFKMTIELSSISGSNVKGKLESDKDKDRLKAVEFNRIGTSNKFESDFIRLVSDDVDRNAVPSRTLLVELRKAIRLSFPSLNINDFKDINVGKDIKEIKLHIIILKIPLSSGSTIMNPVIARTFVEDDVRIANERFAQADIEFTAKIEEKDVPPGVDLGTFGNEGKFDVSRPIVIPWVGSIVPLTNEETKLFDSNLKKDDEIEDIDVFYVNLISDSFETVGISYPEGRGQDNATNSIVIARGRELFTLAHEIMHILLNTGFHSSDYTNLFFYEASDTNTVYAAKRINKSQADTMRGNIPPSK